MLLDFSKDWTIVSPISFEGVGLHSGEPVKMTIEPAYEGIHFFFKEQKIPALVDYVSDTRFCTRLTYNGVTVSTVEHILSALYGKGISAVNIHLSASECPIMDGCSFVFVEGLLASGICELGSQRQFIQLKQKVEIKDKEAKVQCLPAESLDIEYLLDYKQPQTLCQKFSYHHTSGTYIEQISQARTFGFESEINALKEQGLALGGSLDNALVIASTGGYLNQPRYDNECVRHKVLDLLGDFCLLGKTLKAKVFAYKAGHSSHVKMVRRLLKKTND